MGGHGVLEHLLEVIGIVAVEEPAAHQETGVVINDDDAVDPPALAVLRDIRKIARIGLPHLPKGVFFKCFPVPHVRVPCRFEVMVLHEALDGTDADRGGDECCFHKMLMDLGGVQPRESLLEPVDLFDGCSWEHPGGPLIGPFLWHERIDAAVLVEGHPFAEGLGAVLEYGAVRQGKGPFRDPLVIGVPGRIRIKAMDDRGDERQPELRHGGSVRKVLGIVVHKNVLLKWFSPIMGQKREESHAHGVWLQENSSWAEHLLAVRRRIFMRLEEGLCKTADKGGGEIRIGCLHEQGFQEGKAGSLHGGKGTEPLLLLRLEKIQPAAQLGKGDGEAFAEPFHSGKAQEILRQDTEEEEQAIAGVGDNEVREDGMGMAAGTDEAHDAEAVADRGTTYEVHQGTAIIGMDAAGTPGPTAGTGLQLRAETGHEGTEQGL